jgi:hypothetical protein
MPTPTYTPLATVTLTSSASSVTFSNIPATYRDLILVAMVSNASGGTSNTNIRLNGDTGSNYNYVRMYGTGTTASDAASNTANSLDALLGGTGNPGTMIVQVMDYSATNKHKTFLTRIADKSGFGDYVFAIASRWANTAAVTSLTATSSANFQSGNTFSLYGVIA